MARVVANNEFKRLVFCRASAKIEEVVGVDALDLPLAPGLRLIVMVVMEGESVTRLVTKMVFLFGADMLRFPLATP
jgi:hypothetical protein